MCTSKSIKYTYMDNVDDIDDELKCLLCKYPLQSPVSHIHYVIMIFVKIVLKYGFKKIEHVQYVNNFE